MTKNRKALIFDMGGVIVDLDIEGCKNAFKSLLGYYKIDEIIDPCHQKGIYGDLEEGKLSAEEFRSIVLSESRPDSDPADVDKSMSYILKSIAPYKAKLLRRLSADYDLYMLSNNNPISMAHADILFRNAGIPLDELFIKEFLSFKVKALKPSGKFYKTVIEEVGLPSEMMLFIDDSKKNVEGAVAAGLPAVYYEPGTDLSALLAEVLSDPSIKMEEIC